MKTILIIILSGLTQFSFAQKANDNEKASKKVKVFFLAGQSNMAGRARAHNLTKEDLQRLEKVKNNITFYYNHEEPTPLQVTTPKKFLQKKFEAKQLFGPELFFGIELAEAYPDDKFIFIKRAKGGMSLYGAWNPNWDYEKAKMMKEDDDPKLYSDFIAYSKEILKNYDKSGYELCGMLWVQGESDSNRKKAGTAPAEAYEENLKKLIAGARAEFNAPQLPFIMFQVGNKKVVEGMTNIAQKDDYVSLIKQSSDKDSELFFKTNPKPIGHYTCESMKKIGELFFEYYNKEYVSKSKK